VQQVRRASAAPARRPGRVKQTLTFGFAFSAAFSLLLVNLVDPSTVATASADFAEAGDRFGGASSQNVEVSSDFEMSVARESYHVLEKPPPPPPPPKPEPGSTSSESGWAPPAVTPDPGSAQAYAAGAVAARGWPSSEFDCLVALWSKESGWRVNAHNASSGAYGIPQSLPGSKMATAGADWETNPATQIEWGLGYIAGRYSTPCGAWAKSQASGWY
jgi:hypothetical protein